MNAFDDAREWAVPLCRVLVAGALVLVSSALAAQPDVTPSTPVPSADLSSPRGVISSLYEMSSAYLRLVHQRGITLENEQELRNLGQQVEKLFDLREVPVSFKRSLAVETAIYLRDSLARVPPPRLDEIPDEDQMAVRLKAGKAAFYRMPGTPIVVKRTDSGVYEERYQFSSATVGEARNWFWAMRGRPYVKGQEEVSRLYESYFLTPGPLIPLALIRQLPPWAQRDYLEQALWQWLLLAATVIALPLAFMLVWVVVRRLARDAEGVRLNILLLLRPLGLIGLTIAARDFLADQVLLTGAVLKDVQFVSKVTVLGAIVALISRLGSIVTECVLLSQHIGRRHIDGQLIRLGVRMATILISIVLVIEGMQQIGFSLATMVAGAGVTGLAIALAAQDTLKNVFGGLMLALDRPFEVGQRVRIKGYDGTIEDVGLRSTRIRTFAGHQIWIPNEEAARIEVENIARRPYLRREINISIAYGTPPERVARAVEILREILAIPEADAARGESDAPAGATTHRSAAVNHPEYPPRVYLSDLGADALKILVVYWFHPPDHWLALEYGHWVNMQILERFGAEGIEFAFPTRTVHLVRKEKRRMSPDDAAIGSEEEAGNPH